MIKRLFSHYIAEEARPMLRLALPLVLAELGWMTMAIVDTMMVGRQADSAVAIGAVSLGSILFNSAAIFGTGLMLGLDTLVSHSYGAGDVEDCHRSLVNGVYLSLAISPILMGAVWLFEPVLRSLDIQPAVLDQALPYLRTLNWGTLPLLLYFVFRRYLQGMNLAKPVMFALISANFVNVVGNWALVYGHLGFRAMGTVGSGWSTCVARIYMTCVLLVYAVYYDHRNQTGLRNARAAAEFSARLEAGVSGVSGRDAIRAGGRRFRGGHDVDRQAGRGGAGQSSSGAEYREPHVHGAAGNQRRRGGARGASAGAQRRARGQPRRMDRDAAGNHFHGLHGDRVPVGAAADCARVHAGRGFDPHRQQVAFCRGVFSVV